MIKLNRKTGATKHGLKATFENKHVTLIDFMLSFYVNNELINTKEFHSSETDKFVEYIYKLCDRMGIKKTQIHFSDI